MSLSIAPSPRFCRTSTRREREAVQRHRRIGVSERETLVLSMPPSARARSTGIPEESLAVVVDARNEHLYQSLTGLLWGGRLDVRQDDEVAFEIVTIRGGVLEEANIIRVRDDEEERMGLDLLDFIRAWPEIRSAHFPVGAGSVNVEASTRALAATMDASLVAASNSPLLVGTPSAGRRSARSPTSRPRPPPGSANRPHASPKPRPAQQENYPGYYR